MGTKKCQYQKCHVADSTPDEHPDICNISVNKRYQTRHLASFPDPLDLNTLTLIDELGNGGFHSKLYNAPFESNHVYGGPTLPVIFPKKR